MGLAINNYRYSYSRLHRLREWALKVENNKNSLKEIYENKGRTKFDEFINHSDCDGGYISFNKFGITQIKNNNDFLWENLDKLREEVEELNRHKETLEDSDLESWNNFYNDITDSQDVVVFT